VKKIVIISSGQPSLNPRMVKEADALSGAGYDVIVLYAYWNAWGTALDKALIASKKWKAICIGGDPQQKPGIYFLSRLIHKIAKNISQKTKGRLMAELAIARASFFLIRESKKHIADLYIGHNLGALPATIKAAKTNKKPCGFDAEDFHRNEVSDNINDPDVILKTYLEDRYIPQTDYLSASSPLIAEAYQNLYPALAPIVILNVFPNNLKIEQPVINKTGPVRLFWFSQTVGLNRGLEDVIKALGLLKNYPFELHLLGHLTAEAKHAFDKGLPGIHFYEPISPADIPIFASQFDIGLAVENSTPFNRDICLTNKIFTCIQAGLGIVASGTKAQLCLLKRYPAIGKPYQNGSPQALADALLFYHQHREVLMETRKAALNVAHEELNWENESRKFLDIVEKTLNAG
jgi:glycosyltransferase involved in cell wall biosynthesis